MHSSLDIGVESGSRILVIDDNPAIHDDFRKILCVPRRDEGLAQQEALLFGTQEEPHEQADFQIDSAYQGKEGWELARNAITTPQPYAVAFVDVRMPPGWDGIETVRHLWDSCPELQIVLCTAYSDYSWAEMTRELGETDSLIVLKKPFDKLAVLQLAHALTKKWLITRDIKRRMAELEARAITGTGPELLGKMQAQLAARLAGDALSPAGREAVQKVLDAMQAAALVLK
jgi:CheY-like chemotaxis protein